MRIQTHELGHGSGLPYHKGQGETLKLKIIGTIKI